MGLVYLQIAKPATAHTRDQNPPYTPVTLPSVAEGTTTDVPRPNQSRVDVRNRRILSQDSENRRFVARKLRIALIEAAEVAIAVAVAQAPHLQLRGIGAAATHQIPVIERSQEGNRVLHNGAEATTTNLVPSTAADTPRTTVDETLHARTRLQGEVVTTFRVREDVVAPSRHLGRNLAAVDAILATLTSTTVGPLREADPPDQAVDDYPEAVLAPLVRANPSHHPGPPRGVRPRQV